MAVGGLLIQKKDGDVVAIQGIISNLPVGKHALRIHTHGSIGNNCNDAGSVFDPSLVRLVKSNFRKVCAKIDKRNSISFIVYLIVCGSV